MRDLLLANAGLPACRDGVKDVRRMVLRPQAIMSMSARLTARGEP